jgi:RNA polymerase-interacting CarD/CdnL/TRCF family regulator
MTFEVNDWVVHPRHGVGQVVRLEERRFDSSAARLYYEVSIPNGTFWAQAADSSGRLRKLTSKSDLARYRRLLMSRPQPLAADHRQLQFDLTERLRQGSFQARCEVVRDLTAHGWYKRLSEGNAMLLRTAHDALYQEWAAADGLSLLDATREVEALLREGKQTYAKSA